MRDTTEIAAAKTKYLTFSLGSEEYALDILKVREIIGLLPVTPVPQTPERLRGVINLRGKVIPVVDLRASFGMASRDDDPKTCIIVVLVEDGLMGLLVDTVRSVVDVADDQIEPPPPVVGRLRVDYVLGMAKAADGLKILVDVEKIVSPAALEALCAAA